LERRMNMDRLQEIMKAAEKVTFNKTQASALVGGRRRLERLAGEGKISYVRIEDGRFGRWECKGSDVLRYTVKFDT
jgi:ribosomal protein L15